MAFEPGEILKGGAKESNSLVESLFEQMPQTWRGRGSVCAFFFLRVCVVIWMFILKVLPIFLGLKGHS